MFGIPCPGDVYQAELNYTESPDFHHISSARYPVGRGGLSDDYRSQEARDYEMTIKSNQALIEDKIFFPGYGDDAVRKTKRCITHLNFRTRFSKIVYLVRQLLIIYDIYDYSVMDRVKVDRENRELKSQLAIANHDANRFQNMLSAAEDELRELRAEKVA